MEKAILKEHWDRLRREEGGDEDEQPHQVEMTEDEKKEWEELCEEIEMKSQTVYDCDSKTLDFSKMKATDGKANKRVFFPKAASVEVEGMMELRRIEWSKIYDDVIKNLYDDKGVSEINISEQEERGLESLRKKVREGSILICQTDKSGRFAALTRKQYEEAGEKHTRGDQEVSLDYVAANERLINGHVSAWIKGFGIGLTWNQMDRSRDNMINHGRAVCPMTLFYKDHKGWTGYTGGPAPSRSIVAANGGHNVHMSEVISMALEPIARAP